MNKDFLLKDVELDKYNTLGIKAITKYFYMPDDATDLIEKISLFEKENLKYFILGNGSNVILDDSYFDGVIISMKGLKKFEINNGVLTAESGVMLPFLAKKLLLDGYTNFAWASSLPGTVGGSIYGNAEAFKESMFDNLISIECIKDNKIITLNKEDIKYGYRYTNLSNEIIISAKFNLIKGDINLVKENLEIWKNFRIEKQPYDKKSAGSTFRNPQHVAAGKLIDEVGLKGYVIGGAKVSDKHANFIINEKDATFTDIVSLIYYVKNEVKKNSNIDLILENKIIKWDEL